MPVARFQMEDGRVARFEVPEGTTPEQAQELMTQHFAPQKPAAVSAGATLNDIPRQIGLTARYGLEGLANAAQIVTEPIRYFQDKLTPERDMNLADVVAGKARPPKSVPLGVAASNFADYIGLPKPQGANERVIGDATKLLAGSGASMGLAGLASRIPGMTGQVATALASNPAQQAGSAVGAGLAGGGPSGLGCSGHHATASGQRVGRDHRQSQRRID